MVMSDEQKGAASHRLENSGRLGMAQEHEILTSTGWQPVGHLTIYDKVYTLNTKTGEIELYYPDRILSHEHQGYMYQIQTQMVSQIVSENHKIYSARRKGVNEIWTWEFHEAKDLYGKRYKVKRNGLWLGKEENYFTLPELVGLNKRSQSVIKSYGIPTKFKMDDWMEFLGYYIADGSSYNSASGYQIQIAKTLRVNPKTYHKMCKCLVRMGYNIFTSHDKIRFNSKVLGEYLKHLGVAREKYIPQDLFELSARQLKILFNALMVCDGHYTRYGKPENYVTTSKQLADDFQRLLLLIGWSGNISFQHGKKIFWNGREYQCRDHYRIGVVSAKNTPEVNHSHIKSQGGQREKWLTYVGLVYRLSIKNNVLYIRRNGIPSRTGS